jgi:NADPH-dependent glutamate synthase beta subunit-like oxidoreductase
MIEGANVITAIANGHEAARGIDLYLNEKVGTVSS